jgi:hypothetical protein
MIAAHHEAGHALGVLRFGGKIAKVTVTDNGDGCLIYINRRAISLCTSEGRYRVLAWLCVAFCGPAAEYRYVGRLDASSDAVMMATALTERLKLNPVELEIRRAMANRLVAQEWPSIEAVAPRVSDAGRTLRRGDQ